MIRKVRTALAGRRDGDKRTWLVLLDCHHEAEVSRPLGHRPKRGEEADCNRCDDTQPTMPAEASHG